MGYPDGWGQVPPNQLPPNQFPPQYQPGYGFPTPPGYPPYPQPKPTHRGLIVVCSLLAVLILVAAGIGVYYFFVSAKKAAPVKDSALSSLLLTAAEAGKAFNTEPFIAWPPDLLPAPVHGTEIMTEFSEPSPAAVAGKCVDNVADDREFHQGSGWTAVRTQYLQAPDSGAHTNEYGMTEVQFTQSVVAFPDQQKAAKFISSMKDSWQRCADQDFNNRLKDWPEDPDDMWHNGSVSEHDGIVIFPSTQLQGDKWMVMQGIAQRANVVVEIGVQAYQLQDSTVPALISQMRDKVDKAPR